MYIPTFVLKDDGNIHYKLVGYKTYRMIRDWMIGGRIIRVNK